MKLVRGMRRRLCLLLVSVLLVCSMSASAFAVEKSFTLRLEGRVDGAGAEEVNSILQDSFIRLSGQGQDGRGNLNLEVNLGGKTLLRILIQIGENKLAFSFPDVDTKRYEISAQRIVELIGSQIRTGDGVSLEELAPQMLTGPGIDEEQLAEALAPYMEILSGHFSNCVTMEENVSIRLEKLGKDTLGSLLTYEPGAAQLADVFEALADRMENDEILAQAVENLAEYIESLGGLVSVTPFYTEDPEQSAPGENFRESFQQFPRALRESADSLRKLDPDMTVLRFRIGVSEEEEAVPVPLLVKAEVFDEGASAPPAAFGFESLKEDGTSQACLYLQADDQDIVLKLENTGSASSSQGNLVLSNSGSSLFSAVYNWDLTKRSLIGAPYGTLVVTAAPMILTLITADAKQGETRHRLMITGLEDYSSDEMNGLTLDLITSEQADVEAPSGTVTDISGYDVDQLVELFGGIVEQIAGRIGEELDLM